MMLTEGTPVRVKPLRRARWLPARVLSAGDGYITVVTDERLGTGVVAHRFYAVPPERVRPV